MMRMTTERSSIRIEERYFEWLYSLIGPISDIDLEESYMLLAEQLYKKEFRSYVPYDDNRAEDGKILRARFLHGRGMEEDLLDDIGPCSMLELVIAMAEKCEFETAGTTLERDVAEWFWVLIGNVGLAGCNDALYHTRAGVYEEIDGVLETVIERQYNSDGKGGFFPLEYPNEDQRDVELWYQMSSYLLEIGERVW